MCRLSLMNVTNRWRAHLIKIFTTFHPPFLFHLFDLNFINKFFLNHMFLVPCKNTRTRTHSSWRQTEISIFARAAQCRFDVCEKLNVNWERRVCRFKQGLACFFQLNCANENLFYFKNEVENTFFNDVMKSVSTVTHHKWLCGAYWLVAIWVNSSRYRQWCSKDHN